MMGMEIGGIEKILVFPHICLIGGGKVEECHFFVLLRRKMRE